MLNLMRENILCRPKWIKTDEAMRYNEVVANVPDRSAFLIHGDKDLEVMTLIVST